MSFPIPSDSTPTNQKDGRMSQGWYTFLYNLWRPLRNLLKIEDGRVLFMDGDTVNGAIVGEGLTLDRTTNTLSAQAGSGIGDAPADGNQYGRQNQTWTPISTALASPPLTSVQFNRNGAFGGSSNLTWTDGTDTLTLDGVFNVLATSKVKLATGNGVMSPVYFEGSDAADNAQIRIYPSAGNETSSIVANNQAIGSPDATDGGIQVDSVGVTVFSRGAGTAAGTRPITFSADETGVYHCIIYPTGTLFVGWNDVAPLPLSPTERLFVLGNAAISGTLEIGDDLRILGSLRVDGNSNIYGTTTFNGPVVGDIGGAGPWFVPSGQTVTIGEYKQEFFIIPIDVEGTLDVSGYLIEITG